MRDLLVTPAHFCWWRVEWRNQEVGMKTMPAAVPSRPGFFTSLPVLPCPPSSPPSALPHPSRSPCSASSADRKLQLYLAFCKLGGGWNSFGKVFTSAALYFGRLAKTSQASSSALDRFWKVPVPHPSLPQQTVVIPQFYLPDIWAVGESPSFTLCLCARARACVSVSFACNPLVKASSVMATGLVAQFISRYSKKQWKGKEAVVINMAASLVSS